MIGVPIVRDSSRDHEVRYMFEVVSNEELAENVYRLVVQAPRVAAARAAGQFVIVRSGEDAERIPLTIADADIEAGTITLIVQAVGDGTRRIVAIPAGGSIRDLAGPLGRPAEIHHFGRVVCVGGGVGIAVLYPLAKALVEAGNKIVSIIGGRQARHVIFRDELAALSSELVVTTEDGSLGLKGLVTAPLSEILAEEQRRPDAVYAVGPVPMMSAVAELTRPYGIKTIASLNPIMVDGTGMCGGCRVTVDGKIRFACVDGPEFDAHQVDFEELASRQMAYHEDACRLGTNPRELEPPGAHKTPATPAKPTTGRPTMPERDPALRAGNFEEVNLGLAPEMAVTEAERCLMCKKPPCVVGCPVAVRIPEFLEKVGEGDFAAAAEILQADNALPATTGRVCPQEIQCEAECVRGNKGEPVAIGWLERFIADWAAQNTQPPPATEKIGRSVAVVGSGPGGLTAAGELVRIGYDVTIFEALHEPGGVLRYGIPEFRLPNAVVDREIAALASMGVRIECNVVVGKTITVEQIMAEFDACFIANGAGVPVFLNVPGENLKGVYSANEYLTRVNLMGAQRPGSETPIAMRPSAVVFGGGNTAMDAVRAARRLGAERAILAYRRTRRQMPARIEEVHHAEQEGIEFMFLVSPLELLGNGDGWLRGLRLQRMELGEPDDSGRRRPLPVPGSEFELPVELAVVAIGTRANPLLTATCPELKLDKWGNIEVDENQETSIRGVFAGGDIVRGGATVILAMGDGKRAAASIHAYLTSGA